MASVLAWLELVMLLAADLLLAALQTAHSASYNFPALLLVDRLFVCHQVSFLVESVCWDGCCLRLAEVLRPQPLVLAMWLTQQALSFQAEMNWPRLFALGMALLPWAPQKLASLQAFVCRPQQALLLLVHPPCLWACSLICLTLCKQAMSHDKYIMNEMKQGKVHYLIQLQFQPTPAQLLQWYPP